MESEKRSVLESIDIIEYEELDSKIFDQESCKIVIAKVPQGQNSKMGTPMNAKLVMQPGIKEPNGTFELMQIIENPSLARESTGIKYNFDIYKDRQSFGQDLNIDNRKILKNLIVGHEISDIIEGSSTELSINKSNNKKPSSQEKSEELNLKCRTYIAGEIEKLNFISKFLCHCTKSLKNTKELKDLSILISNLSQNELKLVPSLYCPNCFSLFFPILLDCGDSTCFNCLYSSLKNFTSSPSLHSFQLLSCKTCHLNISSSVIQQVLQEDFNHFNQIKLKFHCEVCNVAQSLIYNYWTESPCEHMCANCYSESVLFNHKSCRVCNASFKYAKFSKLRTAQCETCLVIGLSVGNGFRYLEQIFCFSCFQGFAFEEDINFRKIARGYLNKICFRCLETKNIVDFAIKECCDSWICEACFDSHGCINLL